MIRHNSYENITKIYKHFTISYPQILHNMVDESVKIANSKRSYVCKIFDCNSDDVGRLRASFFIDREKFVEYIREVSNGQTPPEWATGCFYNEEIQLLVNVNDKKDIESKIATLTHEMVHLFFQQLIYEKYNIDRVSWLDEAFAMYLDDRRNRLNKTEIIGNAKNLSKISDGFNMNDLFDYNKIKTKAYDGYDMFDLIGKYIFATKQEKEIINTLIKDRNKILELGTHILQDAVNYYIK